MDGLDTLTLEEVTETVGPVAEETQPEPKPKPEPKPDSDAEPTSFLDAMSASLEDADGDPPAKVEEPEPEPKAEDPAPTESRSSKDFKKIKEDRDNTRRELDSLKEKLSGLENSDVNDALKSVKEERDSLSDQLRLAAIERHPQFQRDYEAKIENAVAQAKKLAPEGAETRLAELVKAEESQHRANGLEEIMVELTTTEQAKLGALLARVDEVRGERESALADADSTYQRLMATETERREAHLSDTNKVFDTVAKKASDNLELYQLRDGDEAWNSEVQQRVETARNIFGGDNDAGSLAEASLWAATGPKYRELLGEVMEVNRRLREQLKEQSGASPAVASGGGGSESKEQKSFIDAVNESMGF
jgi:hypothetical protein